MRISTSAVSAAVMAEGALAFFRMECQGRLGVARMDPMMSPGKPAQHIHSFHGSSGISMDTSYQDLRNGECTSCRVTQDKSGYWHPSMYFQDADTGEFELVEQVGGMLAYYQYHLDDLVAFPPGFRMIAGDAMRRNWTTWDPSEPDPMEADWTSLGLETQESYKERSIGFNCLNYDGQAEPTLYRHYLPEKEFVDSNCPNGIRTEINFPSCWNGKDRDSDDHQSHVAYPDRIRSGNCPEDYPVHLPNLLYETIWATKGFEGRNGRFVMANGDALGYGYHGDFMSGWDEKFLQSVLQTCTHKSGNILDCPLFDIVTEEKARECELRVPSELEDEQVEGPLSILPGDMGIIWEDHVEYPDGSPIVSDAAPSGPSLAPNPIAPSSAPVVPEPDYESAPPPALSSSSSPEPPPEPEELAKPEDLAVAAIDPIAEHDLNAAGDLSSAEEPPKPEFPATTPAPEPPAEDEAGAGSHISTQVVTQGNVVSIIYWEEETVLVTKYEDVTTTVTMTAEPSPVKRHVHGYRHARRHGHGHDHRRIF